MNIDNISWKILKAIQLDGRISIKNLAHEVGLSIPATSERLKRLEEMGVISGYRAMVSEQLLGYQVMAVIGMMSLVPDKAKLLKQLDAMPEIIECLHVTGQDSYLLKALAKDMIHLEQLIESINQYGETRTSIVMSQPIPLRAVRPCC